MFFLYGDGYDFGVLGRSYTFWNEVYIWKFWFRCGCVILSKLYVIFFGFGFGL